jgi:hypothetical protein
MEPGESAEGKAMSRRLYVGAALLLSACSNANVREEDASAPDVTLTADAGVDARAPDASNVDAFTPDAFAVPSEVCNGVDDDFDMAIDEGGDAYCSMGIHSERAVCSLGRCLCRAPDTFAVVGAYDDCDGLFGCETELGTNENCGGCGDVCDPASDCRFQAGIGFACGPADILDFSIARADGDIACIVRSETRQRVVCRGPNTGFAISDLSPETANLDWTFVDMPPAAEVRAWHLTRPDGVEALTICTLGTDRMSITCRGDNSTGLLRERDLLPHRGNHLVVEPVSGRAIRSWTTWDGHGFARLWVESLHDFSVSVWADRRTIVPFVGTAPSTVDRVEVAEGVTVLPTGTFFRDAPDLPLGNIAAADDVSCARDVCCSFRNVTLGRPYVGCAGRVARSPGTTTEVVLPPSARLTFFPARIVELAPQVDGRIEGCVRADRGDGSPVRFFCADVTTAADTLGPVSPESFHEEPTRVFESRTPQARADWQAMCIQHRPDWWQCWGTHEGWGHE